MLPENQIIQSLWIGKLSRLERSCLRSFGRQGHEFHLYAYETLDVPEGVVLRDAREIYPQCKVFTNPTGPGAGGYGIVSDLFRYTLLQQRGGWWVDCDVYCLKPFDFDDPYVFHSEDTGVIKVPAQSELMRSCLEDCRNINPNQVVYSELCYVFAAHVRRLNLFDYVRPAEVFAPLLWADIPQYVSGEKEYQPSQRTYAVHLYREAWRRAGLNTNMPAEILDALENQWSTAPTC